MASKFKGLVCMITYGTRELGRACAESIVKRGGKVVLCDVTDGRFGPHTAPQIEELTEELGSDNILFVPTDFTQEEDVKNALQKTQERFGKLDVAITCPVFGKAVTTYNYGEKKPANMEYAEQNIKENLTGIFNVCRLSSELMAKNTPDKDGQRGVIINKSHIIGFGSSLPTYAMTQAGIMGMTLPMARDLKDVGIRVNSIAIGFLDEKRYGRVRLYTEYFSYFSAFPKTQGTTSTFSHLCEQIIENPMINGEVIRLDAGCRPYYT